MLRPISRGPQPTWLLLLLLRPSTRKPPARFSVPWLPIKPMASRGYGHKAARNRSRSPSKTPLRSVGRGKITPVTPFFTAPITLHEFSNIESGPDKPDPDTLATMYDAYIKFNQVHSDEDRSPNWEATFLEDSGVELESLHEAAVQLLTLPGGSRERQALAWRMLDSASELGSRPSTGTLMRIILQQKWAGNASAFPRTQARFDEILLDSPDADFLTLQGIMEAQQNENEKAVATFQQALEVADEDFTWIGTCRSTLARTLLRLGKREEARGHFQWLLDEDYAEGYIGMARLEPEHEMARAWLCKAVASGRLDACAELVDVEMRLARQASQRGDAKASKNHFRFAEEWKRLAENQPPS